MQVKFDLKLSVYSLGLEIWTLSFKFNFGRIGWPTQPPRERVPKINNIVGFWWSIPHWETRVDGNIKFGISLWNEAVEVIEATEAVEAVKIIEAAEILRRGKSLLRTQESSRFLILALFWCFENHFFSGIRKYYFSIFAPFLLEAVEASLGYFSENWFY